jgi:hypothetical protein
MNDQFNIKVPNQCKTIKVIAAGKYDWSLFIGHLVLEKSESI